MALDRIQGALQQGAEDRRLDRRPVEFGGGDEQGELGLIDRQSVAFGEQATVEAQHIGAQGLREAAAVEFRPQRLQGWGEMRRLAAEAGEELGELPPPHQPDIFREGAEEVAHEEAGDAFGRMPSRLQLAGDHRQAFGGIAGHDLGAGRGVEGVGIRPDGSEQGALGRIGQVLQPEAVGGGIGEGGPEAVGAGEIGVKVEAAADIEDDEEGDGRLARRVEGADVPLGLLARLQQMRLVGWRAASFGATGGGLLGLQHEAAAPVAVDPARAGAAGVVVHDHRLLEDIGVVAVLDHRIGTDDAKQFAQLDDEGLVVGLLGSGRLRPLGDEGFSRWHGRKLPPPRPLNIPRPGAASLSIAGGVAGAAAPDGGVRGLAPRQTGARQRDRAPRGGGRIEWA